MRISFRKSYGTLNNLYYLNSKTFPIIFIKYLFRKTLSKSQTIVHFKIIDEQNI